MSSAAAVSSIIHDFDVTPNRRQDGEFQDSRGVQVRADSLDLPLSIPRRVRANALIIDNP